MAASQGGKGNPASHRMSNPNRKGRAERAHARTAKTKTRRIQTAERRHQGNLTLVKAGELTPWEQAKVDRRNRRKNRVERKPDEPA